MSELLPCPFCGSPAIIRHTSMYAVCCTKCHGEIALVYREEDDAVIAWNRRPPPHDDGGLREAIRKFLSVFNGIYDAHPSGDSFEDDARYVWPARMDTLEKAVEKLDATPPGDGALRELVIELQRVHNIRKTNANRAIRAEGFKKVWIAIDSVLGPRKEGEG